jgi:hypothetical protein
VKNLEAMSAGEIMRISLDAPESLFSGDLDAQKREFRMLAKRWHPDRAQSEPGDAAVFDHLVKLHNEAERRLDHNLWNTPYLMRLYKADGLVHQRRYRARHKLELGEMYVGDVSITIVVERANLDLLDVFLAQSGSFRYADGKMQTQVEQCLPRVERVIDLASGGRAVTITKTPDMILAKDLVDHFGGKVEAKHAAWMISAVLNLTCYLEWSNLTHNAIALDTVFFSPQYHSAALLGGWFYATEKSQRLIAIPQKSLALSPPGFLANKVADERIDLDCVRQVGREILGDGQGALLRRDPTVPKVVANWLCGSSSGSAKDDYSEWRRVLENGFGARKFQIMSVSATDVYPDVA